MSGELKPYNVTSQNILIPDEINVQTVGGQKRTVKFPESCDAKCLREYLELCRAIGCLSFDGSII